MRKLLNDFSDHVEHPRYGCGPNVTGLNPDPLAPGVQLHWNATNLSEIAARFEVLTGRKWPHGNFNAYNRDIKRIPGTAILADLTRQTAATVAVTHYSQNLEMAECCLALMESSIFGKRQTQCVRMLLNKIANATDAAVLSRRDDLLERVRLLEG